MRTVATITDGFKVWEEPYETSTESVSSLERIIQADLMKFNRNLSTGQFPRKMLAVNTRFRFSCKDDVVRVVSRFRAQILTCRIHDSDIRGWCKRSIGEVNDLQRLFTSGKMEGVLAGLKRLKDLIKESPFNEDYESFLSEDVNDLKEFFKKKGA